MPGNLFIGDILVPTTVVLQQGPAQSQLVDENAAFTLVFSGLNGPVQLQIPAKGAASQVPEPQLDYSAMWWNASESGWGMSVLQSATSKNSLALFIATRVIVVQRGLCCPMACGRPTRATPVSCIKP
ncbi:MAG: hypothetical protein HC782_05010 [Gammaproteobacteria bacterium]|nr:hypothetical protein [Gammaproteobacteria bacterium]